MLSPDSGVSRSIWKKFQKKKPGRIKDKKCQIQFQIYAQKNPGETVTLAAKKKIQFNSLVPIYLSMKQKFYEFNKFRESDKSMKHEFGCI